jgi:hypothetical protein
MTRKIGSTSALISALSFAVIAGCTTDAAAGKPESSARDEAAARQYGPAIKVGNGSIRTYVLTDAEAGGAPMEVGLAMDEAALEGLPAEMQMFEVPFAVGAPVPYKFVGFDWNPAGHEPETVYTMPHFDFHFYLTPPEALAAIVPTNPNFATEANKVPAPEFIPPFNLVLSAPGDEPAKVAVPQMGVHWIDTRSPELQAMLGNPAGNQPFTKTFLYGSWNGKVTFLEPMITLEHLRSHPNEIVPISEPARVQEAGYYPNAYGIVYDPQAKEYRVSLTGLTWRQ